MCCLLAVEFVSAQPTFSWGVQLGDSSNDRVTCIAKDESGNVFCLGFFSGTIDVDPGPAVYTLTSISQDEIFCCKYASSGNLIFGKKISGAFKSLTSAAVDKQGNLFFCGSFENVIDFDPGAGTNFLDASNGSLFISKWNNQGQYNWTKQFGNDSTIGGVTSLCISDSGAIVVTGFFSGTADLNPGPGFSFYSASGIQDVFVTKINASGDFVFTSCFSGPYKETAHSVACDKYENVVVAGCFYDSMDVDPGTKQFLLFADDTCADIFVCKLKKNGELAWAVSAGGKQDDEAFAIDIDKCGNSYITGFFQDTAYFKNLSDYISLVADSSRDTYLWKLNAEGNSQWLKQIPSAGNDEGKSVVVNISGDIFLAGNFDTSLQLETNPGMQPLVSRGETDVYLMKWNSLGKVLCAGSIGGSEADSLFAMAISEKDEIYVGGIFESSADVDFSFDTTLFFSNGNQDGFVIKSNPGTCCVPVSSPQEIQASKEIICQGESLILTTLSETGTCPRWKWYAGSCQGAFIGEGDTIAVSPTTNSVFFVRQEGPCDTSICLSVGVEVKTSPVAMFDAELSADCKGITIALLNHSYNAQSYQWQFSDGAVSVLQNPAPHLFSFQTTVKILLIALHSNGCTDTAIFSGGPFAFENFYFLEIPNVFSPNGDNINDEYFITYSGKIESCFHLEIFDRWGARVFNSENPNEHWDGRTKQGIRANPGTYFYVLQVAEKKFRGFITLSE